MCYKASSHRASCELLANGERFIAQEMNKDAKPPRGPMSDSTPPPPPTPGQEAAQGAADEAREEADKANVAAAEAEVKVAEADLEAAKADAGE